jgi:hypothetical protein
MGSYRPHLACHVLQRDLDRLARLLATLTPDDDARGGALGPWLRLVLEATGEVGGAQSVAPAAWDLVERLEELADAGPGRWAEARARAQEAFDAWRDPLADTGPLTHSALAQVWLDPTSPGTTPTARRFLRLDALLDPDGFRTP